VLNSVEFSDAPEKAKSQKPTANSQQPTANRQNLCSRRTPKSVHCLQFTVHSLPFTASISPSFLTFADISKTDIDTMGISDIPLQRLELFMSLFRGREDVFALRWAKGGKVMYVPAYQFDPYCFRRHQRQGGTMANFSDKQLMPLTVDVIGKHLIGKHFVGIYPLLQNNTTWFIAADFDDEQWENASLAFLQSCQDHHLPAYLERSASGKGGHVWLFFNEPIEASISRSVMFHLLKLSGVGSMIDHPKSFDRLFPNQDYHSGKGFGNLIALPLNPHFVSKGNCCFVDKHLNPYPDQWSFLETIGKVTRMQIEQLHYSQNQTPLTIPASNTAVLRVGLKNTIILHRHHLSAVLTDFLKRELVFANSHWFALKQAGKSTHKTKQYFKLFEETHHELLIPRGFMGRLIRFCKENKIVFQFDDHRPVYPAIRFESWIDLHPYQQEILQSIDNKDFGVIVAPPGAGKTVMGLKMIALKQLPALIIVHRQQLMDQWVERIQSFLGIPRHQIGRIGQGKMKSGAQVTVAMIQSLKKYVKQHPSDLPLSEFGTILIDECHHIPAESYSEAILPFAPRYQYGLTATPFRKGSETRILFVHLGEIIHEIKPSEINGSQPPRVVVRVTTLDVPFNPKTDTYETLSKVIIHDSVRNRLIAEDLRQVLRQNERAIVITERIEHIEALNQLLKQSVETITLSGADSKQQQDRKMELVQSGSFQVLITTGQYLGEGLDIHGVSALFLVYPFSFKGKLIQYIGRVQRSVKPPVIYDYHDQKIGYLHRLFLKRNAHYRHFDKDATLFDDVETMEKQDDGVVVVRQRISIAMAELGFNYGHFSFEYQVTSMQQPCRFEIENENIRPEFAVLKPYFIKALKAKTVVVEIFAELNRGEVIAQSAVSSDLDRINRELVDGVRFRITRKIRSWIRPTAGQAGPLVDFEDLKAQQPEAAIFDSATEMLASVLEYPCIHRLNLQYLARHHAHDIVKIRFVLHPFSFVFLIKGVTHFHVVLETLDTQEATYLWVIPGDLAQLLHHLNQINDHLQLIRNEGRQGFLANPPENFSRINHQYADPQKGFVLWRDLLEERLI